VCVCDTDGAGECDSLIDDGQTTNNDKNIILIIIPISASHQLDNCYSPSMLQKSELTAAAESRTVKLRMNVV